MNDGPQENQARFIHAFSSPLTAMRGAIDLLRHPRRMGGDPLTRDLIDTLERNYARLHHTINILLRDVRISHPMRLRRTYSDENGRIASRALVPRSMLP
jgi:K+-sensing histidine kinase KdpD